MNPRLKSSKKWTHLPSELMTQIQQVFEDAFKKQSKTGKFIVDGRIFPGELLFRVGYLGDGRLKQANFETSMDFNAKKQNAMKEIQFLMDCTASMIEQYFELDSLDEFPVQWKDYQVENKTLYFQVSTVNTELESQADALLGENSDDLVQGEDTDLEKDAVVTMLGLNEDDENGNPQ